VARRVSAGLVVSVLWAVMAAWKSSGPRPGRLRPRARDGSGGLTVARLASGGGLGRRLCGLTGGAVAGRQELDALGDDVDAGGVAAVLGLGLVEHQAAVDRDLAPGLQVVGAGVRLAVEGLDVEVAVLALLAGALDRGSWPPFRARARTAGMTVKRRGDVPVWYLSAEGQKGAREETPANCGSPPPDSNRRPLPYQSVASIDAMPDAGPKCLHICETEFLHSTAGSAPFGTP
jgi:hypothetical protein